MKNPSLPVFRILLYGILIAPLVLFILYAFSERWFFPELLPSQWTTRIFNRIINDPRTFSGILESIGIALVVSLLSLLIGFPAARVLGTKVFRGRRLAWLIFFIPTVVPPLAVGMGLNILFLRIGLSGTLFGVILAHLVPTLPYTIFTLSGVFSRYDENYENQALVLGVDRVRIFFTVTLRLILPGLVVAALFAFLISWSQYLLTLLIGGGKVLTIPMLLFSAVSGGNPTSIAVLSLIFVIPPVIIIAASSRFLIQNGNTIREQY
ncbi:MAG: ABC transporter permease subunit [Anaerolineaceae bacterium]|jgi:putative spermidine/putrescine transport system permease protein